MGVGETAGIVVITVAIIQGLIGLIKHLLGKQKAVAEASNLLRIENKIEKMEEKLGQKCFAEAERDQLRALYDMHVRYDADGVPLWYVPRSWAETNKEIADKLRTVTELQFKTLGLIERLENGH